MSPAFPRGLAPVSWTGSSSYNYNMMDIMFFLSPHSFGDLQYCFASCLSCHSFLIASTGCICYLCHVIFMWNEYFCMYVYAIDIYENDHIRYT